jgi:hypothetical protein
MKKYFNYSDVIVLSISFIGLIWTICYKFLWIYEDGLFCNADKVADVTYTIFTSVFASGIFYLFTIFLPQIFQVKKAKKDLIENIQTIRLEVYLIMVKLNYRKCSIEDIFERFYEDSTKNINDLIEFEFYFIKAYYGKEGKQDYIYRMKSILSLLNIIMINHTPLLSQNIVLQINSFIQRSNQRLEYLSIENNDFALTDYMEFLQLLNIGINLDKYMNIKNKNEILLQLCE